jgi:nicotinamidase-related amidase
MLIDAARSMLLVIDVQAKLVPSVAEHEAVVAGVARMIRMAQRIGIPVAATEHYAKGLGPLVPAVRTLLPDSAIGAKNHFSAAAAQCLPGLPGYDRAQVVVIGMEAHVCVLQTALDLLEDGKEVYVVADAVGSRRIQDRDVALTRMRDEGIRVVTREMVAFEWLGVSGTALFREVCRDFLH